MTTVTTAHSDSFQTTPQGYTVTHEADRSEFRDQDVLGIRVDTRRDSDAMGNLTLKETLQIHVRDECGERWLSLSAEFGPLDQDPVNRLRQRLLDNLLERSCEQLLAAGDVFGEGWSLSLIHFHDFQSDVICPPQQISAVRWKGDELCLFREGQSEPFARYHRSAENSQLLALLLEHVVEDVATGEEEDDVCGLGRLVTQFTASQPRWLSPRLAIVIGAVPVAAMIYSLPLPIAILGIILLLVLYVATTPLITGTPATLRLYEQALVWTRGSDEVVLLFDEIDTMTVSRRNRRQADASVAPQVDLAFESVQHPQHRLAFWSVLTPENRDLLESMIVGAADILATRMLEQLKRNESVRWTAQLKIERDRLSWQHEGPQATQVIHPQDLQGWSLSDTRLILALNNGGTISIPTSCPNFYPGLLLLRKQGWF